MSTVITRFWYDVYTSPPMSFHFTLERYSSDEVRIYIDRQPDYPAFLCTDGHKTHRYGLGSGRPYVCYDPPPDKVTDARSIAESWARHTARYIQSGIW